MRSYGLVPLCYFNSMLDEKFLPEYAECAAKDLFLRLDNGAIYTFIYKVGPATSTCESQGLGWSLEWST